MLGAGFKCDKEIERVSVAANIDWRAEMKLEAGNVFWQRTWKSLITNLPWKAILQPRLKQFIALTLSYNYVTIRNEFTILFYFLF